MARTSSLPPPQDPNVEAAFLGAVLLNARHVLTVVNGLPLDAFIVPLHQDLWRSVRILEAAGQPIDAVTVSAQARSMGCTIDDTDLLRLQADVPSVSAAPAYAATILDLWNRRQIIQTTALLSDSALQGTDIGPYVAKIAELTAATRGRSVVLDRMSARILDRAALEHIERPSWLIDGFIPIGSLGMLYGPSGAGKTFAAIAMACSVASGIDFLGKAVAMRRVLYVAAEGVGGIRDRVRAWEDYYGVSAGELDVYRGAINLADPTSIEALRHIIVDGEYGFAVFDTLFRCMVGADENKAVDVAPVIAGLDTICDESQAAIMPVHHSGKDATKGGRGSSAIKGALDFEIEMADAGTLRVTKQKDAGDGWGLTVHRVAARDSMALATSGESLDDPAAMNVAALKTLDELRRIAAPNGVPNSWWQKAAEEAGISARTFMRHKKMLLDTKPAFVTNIGSEKLPRYQPTYDSRGEAELQWPVPSPP